MDAKTWNKQKNAALIITGIFLVLAMYGMISYSVSASVSKSRNIGYIIGYILGSNLLIPLSLLLSIASWLIVLFGKPKTARKNILIDVESEMEAGNKDETLNTLTNQKERLNYLLKKNDTEEGLTDEEFEELRSRWK